MSSMLRYTRPEGTNVVEKNFDISNWTGDEILPKFTELVEGKHWAYGSIFKFFIGSPSSTEPEFTILPHYNGNNQPGNALIKFPFEATWDAFAKNKKEEKNFLKRGFESDYDKLNKNRFFDNNDFLQNPEEKRKLGCYVLLQFEIARRVKGEPKGFPSRNLIERGIRNALESDTKAKYKEMVKMFSGANRCWEAYWLANGSANESDNKISDKVSNDKSSADDPGNKTLEDSTTKLADLAITKSGVFS